jgi:hypothetical protein
MDILFPLPLDGIPHGTFGLVIMAYTAKYTKIELVER